MGYMRWGKMTADSSAVLIKSSISEKSETLLFQLFHLSGLRTSVVLALDGIRRRRRKKGHVK